MSRAPTPISVKNLTLDLATEAGAFRALHDVSFSIAPAQTLALIGPSGCGKSMTALALMRLLPDNARVRDGQVLLGNEDLFALSEREMQSIRGRRLSIIFQEPATSLNPVMRIGDQIIEAIQRHRPTSEASAQALAIDWLERVGLQEPKRRVRSFPFELSGGQLQRVMIAMALCTEPDLLIADEPTTALDVTLARQILTLLGELQREKGLSMLLISHDLGVVKDLAHEVALMSGGKITDQDRSAAFFARHASMGVPALAPRADQSLRPLALDVQDLRVAYTSGGGLFRERQRFEAVRGVSLSLPPGQTLALVGESGSGKTTVAKAILGLLDERAQVRGEVLLSGLPALQQRGQSLRALRRHIQIVFQNPFASLNPRHRVSEMLEEGMRRLRPEWGRDVRRKRLLTLMDQVRLPVDALERFPHEFSGGQRQRIAIARALAVGPRVIVCDEPTSALDADVQAQILTLLHGLQLEEGLSYLLITHNMAVVRSISHLVAVMCQGEVVESGPTASVFENPRHSYTRTLLAAMPQ
ncbi:MAG: ABC transporter ATP-binding protein [Betaproteobacteria bacterium]|nr:ABC transporter ATP-binding protein [Betaproteobacteria bacterium]